MIRDNRLHPRVKADFDAKIIPVGSDSLTVPVLNISIAGIMIKATQEDFNRILSMREQLESSEPTELYIQFQIPDAENPPSVDYRLMKLYCRAIHVRRKSQNDYIMGFNFLNLADQEEDIIQAYINKKLAHPAGGQNR